MRMAIIGYGKLGKAVGIAWENAGGTVTHKIDSTTRWEASDLDCDLVLESSTPTSAAQNIRNCINAGLPVVVGSTGWHSEMPQIEDAIEKNMGQLFHATNFSIGVHLLNVISTHVAQTLSAFEEYTPSIVESHHIHKLDKPSGTAITLSNKVQKAEHMSEIPINSIREGEIIGTHELIFDSEIDSISIKHEAKNRKGFALGAVKAANWLLEQKSEGRSGIFTMDDMINDIT